MISHCVLAAVSPAHAATQASAALNLAPDAIETALLPDGRYYAHATNADAACELAVPEDGAAAVATAIYPAFGGGAPLSITMLETRLADASVKAGILPDALQSAVAAITSTGLPVFHVTVARAIPPVHGKPGRLKFHVNLEKTIGQLLEDGRMDFRERNMPQGVAAGGAICDVIPPAPGQDGMTVFGTPVPHTPGAPAAISAGENVITNDQTHYTAAIDGIVMFKGHVLSVHEGYEHAGDVDFDSGHLDCKGFAIIKGAVQSTFNVSAKSHLTITETAGDCLLTAGGDIDVLKGVFHARFQGKVASRGSVRTPLAHQAWIEADEDIHIAGEAIQCHLKAGGKVICTGKKGTIIGGTTRGTLGIEAKTAGSEQGVKTVLKAGYDLLETEAMRSQMNHFRREIKIVSQVIGEVCDEAAIRAIRDPEKQRLFAELHAFREESRRLLDELIRTRRQLMDEKKVLGGIAIRILETIHPGVELYLYHETYVNQIPQRRVEFYLDPATDKITARSLS